MSLEEMLNNVNTLAIVCNQWGDTGKGKFVDFFGEWADIIIRGTGGANAGHTICLNGEQYIFHLIPSGIIHDSEGKYNVIGNGVAFDPAVIKEEIELLEKNGKSWNNLRIAYNAKLVLPQHIAMDRIREAGAKKGKIGTTGRGIGPVYTDFYARTGLFVNDMLNKDIFVKRLKKNLEEKIKLLNQYDPETVKDVFNQKILGNGRYYQEKGFFNVDAIVETYVQFGELLKDKIIDADKFARENAAKNKKTLLEGAQGLLLSVDYGTTPFVTSSDCSVRGLAKGCGLFEADVDLTLGIVKAFYMTRVGGGPFPTEFGGKKSEEHCANPDLTKSVEKELFPRVSVNSKDEFEQGVAARQAGGEYGATTGRPRRTGWLDLPLLKYASRINGRNVILTKVDVLDNAEEIKICKAYCYEGPSFNLGRREIGRNMALAVPPTVDSEFLKWCKPIYDTFEGWKSDISSITKYDDLPQQVKNIINFVQCNADVDVRIVSVGQERNQTIVRKSGDYFHFSER